MNTETIHIAFNIDDNYLKHCCVTLTSLFENNKEENIHVYILYMSLSEDSKHIIRHLIEAKYAQSVSFCELAHGIIDKFPLINNGHISASTYIRLFQAEILPKALNKVIYLDCDLIVEGKIIELWNTNVDNVALACVEDMWSGRMSNYERLQYSPEDAYFNAGVLLVNLEYWRQVNTGNLSIECIQRYGNLRFFDQDILNILFHDNKKWLSLRWNIQDGFLKRKPQVRQEILEDVKTERFKKGIIHYTGGKKPWNYRCCSPFRNRYFHYLDMTQWAGERPAIPLKYKIKTLLNTILTKLRLKSAKHCYVNVPAYKLV